MSPALNGSSEIQHFERADVIEIHDGIMLVFYPGLPHMYKWQQVIYMYRISLYKGPGVDFLPATFDPALKRGRRLNGAGVYKRMLTHAYKN